MRNFLVDFEQFAVGYDAVVGHRFDAGDAGHCPWLITGGTGFRSAYCRNGLRPLHRVHRSERGRRDRGPFTRVDMTPIG